jgi:hypothetical protein
LLELADLSWIAADSAVMPLLLILACTRAAGADVVQNSMSHRLPGNAPQRNGFLASGARTPRQ